MFTEGFDTLDLKEAKALLDGLAPWRSRRPGRSMSTTMLASSSASPTEDEPGRRAAASPLDVAAAEILKIHCHFVEKRR